MNTKKRVAIGQVLLLILAIMAFGFILGSEVEVVSAAENCGDTTDTQNWSCVDTTINDCVGTPKIGLCPGPTTTVCCSGFKEKVVVEEEEEEKKDLIKTGTDIVTKGAALLAIQDKIKNADKKLKNAWKSFSKRKKPTVGNVPTKPIATKDIGDVSKMTADQIDEKIKEGARILKEKEEALVELEKLNKAPDTNAGIFLKNLKDYYTGNIWGPSTATLGSGVGAGITAAAGAYATLMIFKVAGAGERNLDTIGEVAKVVAVGSAAFFITWGAFGSKFLSLGKIPGPGWVLAGAVAVTAIVSAVLYKTFSQETFNYQLALWQPIAKGENCQLCNDLEYGCSEYQCKTFGAGCEIINPGTQKEVCDWINEKDSKPPIMDTLDILAPGYTYNPDPVSELQDTGVTIKYNGECLPAFEGIEFGITTDEPAQCKIDMERVFNYDNMTSFMQEGSVYVENHTFSIPNIALPSAYAINEAGFTLDEGNNYQFYMRCKDVNDNISPFNFAVKFCVDDGPDTTAPTISTNYINGAYIRSDQVEINDLEVYTNEPAECRWDFLDKSYENMQNEMIDCSMASGDYTFPASYSYGCRTTLTGVKNDVLNTYYIRCEDKPSITTGSPETRISNQESYILELQGTDDLVIDEILINQENSVYTVEEGSISGIIIRDATETIQVRIDVLTSQGAGREGDARCTYSESGLNYEFYNNQNYDYTPINNHYWYLEENVYDFGINCCDLANNCDSVDISFEVDSDTSAPEIARSYYEEGLMKLVTTEESECTYSLSTCNYLVEDGLNIDTLDNINHFVSWDEEESFYIKCKDVYGNYPDPNECSIIVRAQYEYEDIVVLE